MYQARDFSLSFEGMCQPFFLDCVGPSLVRKDLSTETKAINKKRQQKAIIRQGLGYGYCFEKIFPLDSEERQSCTSFIHGIFFPLSCFLRVEDKLG